MKKNLFLFASVFLCNLLLSFSSQAQLNSYNVTGGGSFCSNDTGVHVGLDGSDAGVPYQLYNGGIAVGEAVTGTGGSIDFGLQTSGGTYSVTADPGEGDATVMNGTATVTSNTSPSVHSVTGGGAYCDGGIGVSVGLDGSDNGVSYQLYNGDPAGSAVTGGGSTVTFGLQTTAGTYTVVATNSASSCTTAMSGSAVVTVNPMPDTFTVSGGGTFCSSDTGAHVFLSSSVSGINYQLYNGDEPAGATTAGNGAGIDFGLQTTGGYYTVVATNATTSCSNNMTGSATVTSNPIPPSHNVTGGGPYCSSAAGVSVGLDGSDEGIGYQLFVGDSVAASIDGSGSPLNFGIQSATGIYTIVAINGTTSCTDTMAGSTSISVNPLPDTFTVTGGSTFCADDTGAHVFLSSSVNGINYQLYNGEATAGAAIAGNGSSLDFGLQTAGGTYTVVAANATTSCTSNMTGSAVMNVNPIPPIHNVTGGGIYCAGGTGYSVGLDGSDDGITYQLYNSVPLGDSLSGSGSSLDFGIQSVAGSYTIVATNATTGCTMGMAGNAAIIVNPVPDVFTVSGGGTFCVGDTGAHVFLSSSAGGINYQLYNGEATVGTALSGNSSPLDFGLQTAGGTYTVVATNATTTCTSNMTGSAAMIANPLPPGHNVTGGGAFCAGGTGVTVGLNGSDAGISYQLYNTIPAGVAIAGSTSVLNFGLQTNAGTYTIVATDTTTYCTSTMTGNAVISVNTLPDVFSVSGGGIFCAGDTGVHVFLSSSASGINYQLYNGSSATGEPVAGNGSPLDFGITTISGTYTVVAANTVTACTSNMTGSAVVTNNPLPAVFSVGGGGFFCVGGPGIDVALNGSATGINYQLYNNGSATGSPLPGTGTVVDFGNQTVAGTYTVIASNASSGCTNYMLGNAGVVINPAPVVYSMTGGGSFCSGGTGVNVGLTGSDPGIMYQLYNASTPVGSPVTGTGYPMLFGLQTAAGSYGVVASPMSICATIMSGTSIVNTLPLPTAYSVVGGGNYCPGGAGMHVYLNSSDIGTSYQLYANNIPVGVSVPGTSGAIDFGLQTIAGNYTVMGTNATTTCVNTMSGSATVAVNSLPVAFSVLGGGNYCVGGVGEDVSLSGTETGTSYQLMLGLFPVGTAITGAGESIDFGLQTASGSYTVVATNPSTGCSANMSGSATVTANPLPNVYTVTGGGSYCSGGTGVAIGLNGSDVGVQYQLYQSSSVSGSFVTGNGFAITFGNRTTAGSYSVVATNGTTGCTSNMFGSTSITINSLPTPFTVTGGGGYCVGGTGVHVGLGSSEIGTTYQLSGSSIPAGGAAGTGSPLDFGAFTSGGTYTVIATNAAGCVATMPGSAIITVNPLPNIYSVTPSALSNYCAGGSGVAVGLSGSGTGISYQLYNGATLVTSVAGTGSPIGFGPQTAGSYTVVASNTTTTCSANMTGSASIIANPLPTAFSVTGGGGYCAGGSGVDVGLSASNTGISYTLMNGASPVVTYAGIGSSIDFGLQANTGTYTIVAVNTTTLCNSTMSGSAVVTINPLPNSTYLVNGGGAYCSGGSGVDISISSSDNGINYQLVNAGTPIGSILPGYTGTAVDFGLQTAPGTYTVLATNATTSCVSTLAGNAIVSINPSPSVAAVTGGGAYCNGTAGAHVGLSSSSNGISYQLMNGIIPVGLSVAGTGSTLDFGAETAGSYSVVGTNTTNTCSANMSGTVIVTADPALANYTITGGGSYCPGGTGVHVGLESSGPGINYQLTYAGTPVGIALSGTGTLLDFGLQTAGGVYTVVATNGSTGCNAAMPGTATVTISPLPTVHNITGGGNYCPGGAGVNISLDGSDAGVNYQLMNGSTPLGTSVTGTGSSVSFGLQTATGAYSVVATNGTSTCTANMAGSVRVGNYPLPAAEVVTGGGNYCPAGTGVHVGLSSSGTGVDYQLYNGEGPVGLALPGTGFSLDFGLETATGTYTVVASNPSTTCTSNMTGSANVAISPLPTAFNVTGGGNYCASGSGVHVGLYSSASGIDYQLYNGIFRVGSPVTGTGASLDFGAQTATGTYTVIATSTATTCTNTMAGNAAIAVNPLPAAHTISAGGSYCAGGAGIDVNLNSSNADVNYQLYNGTTATGLPVTGSGTLIDFGDQPGGIYTIVAADMTTGCTNTMSGASTIIANPLPNAYTVTGGGNYCNGGAGVHVTLSGSNTGISYQAFVGGTPSGSAIIGTGAALDLGLRAASGAYSIVATNVATGCSSTMTGTATVAINSLPVAYTVSSSGSNYCAGGEGIDVALSGSTYGINYLLYNGATVVGSAVGSGSGIDFGLQTGAGTYTVKAIDPATMCNNSMTGAATILVNPLPAAYSAIGGGSYCNGGTGVHVGLNGSHAGTSYQLMNGGAAAGSPVTGTGLPLDFGLQTIAGSYSVVATNAGTGCTSVMADGVNVSINPLPSIYTVTGGGNYCAGGTGLHIGLTGSTSGINYQLYNGAAMTGAAVVGTGVPADFGPQTISGPYTVMAVNIATGCSSTMTGSATIGTNSLPVVYAMSGGGNYCPGGVGVSVGLGGSGTGIVYQLYNGSATVGGPAAGSGGPVNFGLQTAAGTYSIVATNTVTGCTSNMSGTASVGINALPIVYSVIGGGNYCASGTGVHVGLNSSTTGVNYQLYNGSAIGLPMAGTGGPVDFGLQTATGTYTVVAADGITTCTNNMSGSASVGITALVSPAVTLAVSTGDTACEGHAVTINSLVVNGGTSPTYSWSVNGEPLSATGSSYTYVPANGDVVSVTMTSSAACATPTSVSNAQGLTVLANGNPTISVAATPGQVVCQGTSVTFNNTNTFGGTPAFTWFVNGMNMGATPSLTYTPSNSDVVYAIMNSSYYCRLENSATSNHITMEVDDSLLPSVTIAAYPGTNIAKGQSLTLTASVSYGGPAPLYQWYLNGVALPGATDASLTGSNYNNGDSVTCQVISSGGCSGLSGYNSVRIGVGTEGVQQIASAGSDIKLSPNPNKGIFTIKGTLGTTDNQEVTIEVTDMLGQVIYNQKVIAHNGNINEHVQLNNALPNGMYILNLHSGNANNVFHMVIEQ